MILSAKQRVRLPGESAYVTIDNVFESPDGVQLYVIRADGRLDRVDLTRAQSERVEILSEDGGADPALVLCGLWSAWMRAAAADSRATALATSPLRPYLHQNNAVYGAMLPQPRLRFLLADEPGTGKTIMAGLYLREMQRLGFVRRCLIVAPAHLVPKWQADFERFFGGGLRRISAATAHEGPLRPDQDLWIVSLDLAAVNPRVQEVIRPSLAGWDLVIFDEAHRLTPTAQSYYSLGRALCGGSPRVLLMTATPHRGKEWLFRALMHLVDPQIFPEVAGPDDEIARRLRPGALHFLRRMKEDLVDHDGDTPLFHGRHAANLSVALNPTELAFYNQALEMVSSYFPAEAVPLASMVYGKRAASSLYALARTLRRRRDGMGTDSSPFADELRDPDEEDATARDEAYVIAKRSQAAADEKREIAELLAQLEPLLEQPEMPVSKWPRMLDECLAASGVLAGNREQAVVFTEYADTADWLVRRFQNAGFSAERYSGRDGTGERESVRERFAQRRFQILVSTDAGNEGIDLQTAHVLVNWDIPWSLVRLEQRMGRIHRIGQTRDVELYNLVAIDTREGEVLSVLLDHFVAAANALGGKMFDSLSAVAELVGLDPDRLLAETFGDSERRDAALSAARSVTTARLRAAAERAAEQENELASGVDVAEAVAALQREALERINPRIVESYLDRLHAGGLFCVTPHAGGEGLYALTAPRGCLLPPCLGQERQAIIASSADALSAARAAGADIQAMTLGPSEPAFRGLVQDALEAAGPSLFQGGTLADPTSVTDYDLVLYEGDVVEAGGRRQTVWSWLIKVDHTGGRPVRWETLANLGPTDGEGRLHPTRAADADVTAVRAATERQARQRQALSEWLRGVETELRRLPSALSATISDPPSRRAMRARLTQAVQDRLQTLPQMAEVTVSPPRRVGWARVRASGAPPDPTEKDSEAVSMACVASHLRSEGWAVADVHQEGRGYDLHAARGRAQRCVEVKGVWESAASAGIRMVGDEVLIARQHGPEYWLYVVDQCSAGGRLFGAYQDPVSVFGSVMKDVSVIRIPGSALAAARGEPVPA